MGGNHSESIAALRRALDATSPPITITQEAFDHDAGHLHRLMQLTPAEPAKAVDLSDYAQDLRYTEIQRDLLTYLLPVCLDAWRDDLRGARDYGGFVEQFYPVLADCHVFDSHLTPKQAAAVSEFMRQSILAEIDDQRGLSYGGMHARPYRWTRALTTYGRSAARHRTIMGGVVDSRLDRARCFVTPVRLSADVPQRRESRVRTLD